MAYQLGNEGTWTAMLFSQTPLTRLGNVLNQRMVWHQHHHKLCPRCMERITKDNPIIDLGMGKMSCRLCEGQE